MGTLRPRVFRGAPLSSKELANDVARPRTTITRSEHRPVISRHTLRLDSRYLVQHHQEFLAVAARRLRCFRRSQDNWPTKADANTSSTDTCYASAISTACLSLPEHGL